MKIWLSILVATLSTVLVLKIFSLGQASVQQPIQYNHSKHIEAGLACGDCHVNAETGIRASIPTLAGCLECHEEAVTDSREEEKMRTLSADGIQYPWIQITSLEKDVLFSHRRHVGIAKIECRECHGKMEELTEPPARAMINMTMKFCMNCHRDKNVTNDCLACHR